MQRCAEGFNSGVKGLNRNAIPVAIRDSVQLISVRFTISRY
jgi:hypothetical protein